MNEDKDIFLMIQKREQEIAQQERDQIVEILRDKSRCSLDGGHDKDGFCFCEAVSIVKDKS